MSAITSQRLGAAARLLRLGTLPITAIDRSPMARFIGRRIVLSCALIFAVTGLSFVLVSLTPGDPARRIVGPSAPHADYLRVRHQLGLDTPIYQQYWTWLTKAFHGDLGVSLFTGQPVTQAIGQRLSVTLTIILGSLAVSVLIGVALGVLSAVRGGVLGRATDTLALLGFAIPSFWFGALLVAFFAVKLRWFPATGYVPPGQSLTGWAHSLALPIIALSLSGITAIQKQTREAMLDALSTEYIRIARGNGVSARSLYFKHALKNASVRIITMIGLLAISLLGATIVIENVFGLPGLGSLVVQAIQTHDLPIIQGVVLCFTLAVVFINISVDLGYAWLNPRMHVG